MIKYNTLENIESYLLIGKKKSLLKTAFSYLNPGEQLLNVTKGGGESLVIYHRLGRQQENYYDSTHKKGLSTNRISQ